MAVPDSLVQYIPILVLVALACVLFLLYRLWRFAARQFYRLTHPPSRVLHLDSGISVRVVPGDNWLEETALEDWDDDEDARDAPIQEPAEPETPELSPREKEVARMARDGMSDKAIAQALNISTFTVRNHMGKIRRKLHIESRAELKYLPPELLE